jgi:hypothetical protein
MGKQAIATSEPVDEDDMEAEDDSSSDAEWATRS